MCQICTQSRFLRFTSGVVGTVRALTTNHMMLCMLKIVNGKGLSPKISDPLWLVGPLGFVARFRGSHVVIDRAISG
jgi:hypothetical protein